MKFGAPPAPMLSPFLLRMDDLLEHAGLGDADAVDGLDLREQRLVDRRGRLVAAEARRLRAGDGDVDALARGLEDVGERLVDRVREDVGPGDHRDAEHDGERRQGGAQLARAEPASGST